MDEQREINALADWLLDSDCLSNGEIITAIVSVGNAQDTFAWSFSQRLQYYEYRQQHAAFNYVPLNALIDAKLAILEQGETGLLPGGCDPAFMRHAVAQYRNGRITHALRDIVYCEVDLLVQGTVFAVLCQYAHDNPAGEIDRLFAYLLAKLDI